MFLLVRVALNVRDKLHTVEALAPSAKLGVLREIEANETQGKQDHQHGHANNKHNALPTERV